MEADPIQLEQLLAQRDWLRRLALRLVHDADAAEDLTQDALILAMERGGASREGNSTRALRGWLSTVVRRLSAQRFRSGARRRAREAAVAHSESSDPAALERAALQRDIVDEVLRLDEPYRTAVTLRYLESRTFEEIAAQQGVRIEAARKRVTRGIEQLRMRLDGRPGGRAAWLTAMFAWGIPPGALTSGSQAVPAGSPAPLISGPVPTSPIASLPLAPALAMKSPAKALVVASVLLLVGAAIGLGLLNSGQAASPGIDAEPSLEVAVKTTPEETLSSLDSVSSDRAREDAPVTQEVASLPPSIEAFPDRPRPQVGTLELHIRWSDGTPAEGVTAKVMPWGDPTPRQRQHYATTNERGVALVESISQGTAGVYLERGGGGRYEILAGRVTLGDIEIPEGFELSGTVRSASGDPVAGASIVLSEYGNGTETNVVGTTNDEGRYKLRDVGDGRTLSARAPGHAAARRIRLDDMAPGQAYETDLTLGEGSGGVRGVLQDENGVPVSGARLRIAVEGYRSGSGKAHPIDLVSDDAGAFECLGLGPGKWLLMVKTEAFVGRTIYFQVPANEVVEQTITLAVGATVTGTILRADGSPATGATVALGEKYEQYEYLGRFAQADSRGAYTISGIAPGAQAIGAYERDQGKARGQLTVAAGDTASWDAQLTKGREVSGKLVDERGGALVGWRVGTRTSHELWDRNTSTGEDGSFTLADVRTDAVKVAVAGPRSLGTGVLLTMPIEEGPMLIHVPDRLRPSSGVRFQVLFEGKAPPKPARVLVQTEGYGRKEVYTDDSGLVSIDSLQAGLAEIEVSAAGLASAYLMADLQPGEIAEMPAVSLARGGQIKVHFSIPMEEDPTTAPNQITVYSEDGRFVNFTDLEDGSGTTDPIAPGTYSVRINSGGRTADPLLVTVEDETITEVTEELKPHGTAVLNLVDGAGAQYSGRVRYRVVDGNGRAVIPWTRVTKRPMAGMPKTRLYFNGLPQGSFTAEVEGERGARAEARFSITKTGFGYVAPEAKNGPPEMTLDPGRR